MRSLQIAYSCPGWSGASVAKPGFAFAPRFSYCQQCKKNNKINVQVFPVFCKAWYCLLFCAIDLNCCPKLLKTHQWVTSLPQVITSIITVNKATVYRQSHRSAAAAINALTLNAHQSTAANSPQENTLFTPVWETCFKNYSGTGTLFSFNRHSWPDLGLCWNKDVRRVSTDLNSNKSTQTIFFFATQDTTSGLVGDLLTVN